MILKYGPFVIRSTRQKMVEKASNDFVSFICFPLKYGTLDSPVTGHFLLNM